MVEKEKHHYCLARGVPEWGIPRDELSMMSPIVNNHYLKLFSSFVFLSSLKIHPKQ